jgi:myosin heavy subunit
METTKYSKMKIHKLTFLKFFFPGRVGSTPDKGVTDMTCIPDIDENGINNNLKVRYQRDEIYVSFIKNLRS